MFFILALISASQASTCLDHQSPAHTMHIHSGTSTRIYDANNHAIGHAKLVPSHHQSWTAHIPGAHWIWETEKVTHPDKDQTTHFHDSFFVNGLVHEAILQVAADNKVVISVNGHQLGCDLIDDGESRRKELHYNVARHLKTGHNTVDFKVTNIGHPGSTEHTNPAGLLYLLSFTERYH